jgi:toxin FitB
VSGYLLDTNIPSETLRPLSHANVAAWLERQTKESQFLSVVTIGELRRGTTLLSQGARRTNAKDFGGLGIMVFNPWETT